MLKQRSTVHFLHPHRGGGTTLCALAQAAGERANWAHNCNFGSPYEQYMLRPSVASADMEEQHWSCAAQLAFARQRRYTLVARETYLIAPPPGAAGLSVGDGQPPLLAPLCAGFLYVTVLRDPLSRIPADYCIDSPHWRSSPKAQRGALALADTSSDAYTSGFWNGARWSNYYTRILLGREAFASRVLPPDALQAANRTLGAFHAVVVLERLEEQLPLLEHALGWPDGTMERWRSSPRVNHLTPDYCTRSNWTMQLEEGFADANRLDLALYEWWTSETERRLAAL